jgi:arsenate reductase-like glutaredoxin family protein
LIPGQRKRFKEKNWMQNFSEILKRGRDSHLLLKMLKKMVMGTMKRINRPRDRKMRKLSLKRKAMMRKKAAR